MNEVGIQFEALAEGQTFIRIKGVPLVGQWLKRYDPDAHEGLGEAEFTDKAEDALRFPDFDTAKAFWAQDSTIPPPRGFETEAPTAPLTVVSVQVALLDT